MTDQNGSSDESVRTLAAALQRAATTYGGIEAVVDGEVRFDFAELADRVATVRRALIASGIERGDRLSIWAPNCWEWIVTALGITTAGAILVPLNTRYKASEAAFILERSKVKMVFTLDGFLGNGYIDAVESQRHGLPHLNEIVDLRLEQHDTATGWNAFLARADGVSAEDGADRAASVRPDDISDILFTSGTTGRPKGVMITHGQNTRMYIEYADRVCITTGSRYLIVNPFFHSFGYKGGILASLVRGVTMLPVPVLDLDEVFRVVERERVDILPGPPTLYQSMLDHPGRDRFDLTSLRVAITGAATVPVELIKRMRAELTFDVVITAYGLTEVGGTATTCVVGDDPETIATTAGSAIEGVELRIIDAEGADLPPGQPGEVLIRSYGNMIGYLDDPEETAKTIDAEGWLHSGDIGILDDRGYLRITDRLKDMFIVGGFNVYPAEIENTLLGHEGLSQVAVIGIPDERLGEVGMAFVVPRPGAVVTPEEIIAWCRERMANFKVPRAVEVIAELPKNATGKVAKVELRAEVASR